MDLYTKNLVEEFEKKRPLYEDFCLSVNDILCNFLQRKKYKYQIYYRVKSIARLKEKILRKRKLKKIYRKLSDIDDLSGIRIIFYLESEKEKFAKDFKKIMPNIINVEELEKSNGYKSTHMVIVSDNKKFKNFRCEIQLVSLFNHAWAELEHDWLYKDAYGLKSKNPEQYITLKKQMQTIFKHYVRKLTSKLEKVAKQLPGKKKV